jgi:hypothetical protein
VVIHGNGVMFSLWSCEKFTSDAEQLHFCNFVIIASVDNLEMGIHILYLITFYNDKGERVSGDFGLILLIRYGGNL